jgi:hypothetical protein
MKRLVSILAVLLLSLGGVAATAPTASADVSAKRVHHRLKSDRKYIYTTSEYRGKGKVGWIERGQRPERVQSIASVFVPAHCSLWANKVLWYRSWDGKSHFTNIGKFPWHTLKLELKCRNKN